MVSRLDAMGSEHLACPIGKKSLGTLRWIPWLRDVLRKERVDVLDYHSRVPGWVALGALQMLPKSERPVCVSSLNGLHRVSFYSGVMCRGDAVVVVSHTVREYVEKHFPWVPKSRIHVIYRGIDDQDYPRDYAIPEAWHSAFDRQFPETTGKRLLTIVGRLTRLKGHLDFVRMIAKVWEKDKSVHGLIVGPTQEGKEAYRDEVKGEIQRLGISQAVTFTGARSDLKEIYRRSAIVYSLSNTPESFGRTVAESLAIGTPVVGYNHGGVSEILRSEFPRGAVELGDIETLVHRTREILEHSEPLEIATNQFRLCDMQSSTLRLYEDLVRKREQEFGRQDRSIDVPSKKSA